MQTGVIVSQASAGRSAGAAIVESDNGVMMIAEKISQAAVGVLCAMKGRPDHQHAIIIFLWFVNRYGQFLPVARTYNFRPDHTLKMQKNSEPVFGKLSR